MIHSTPELEKLRKEYIISSVSDQELERRWDAVVKVMAEKDVDYIVAVSRTDLLGGYVKWFTDSPAQSEYIATVIFSRDKEIATIFSDYCEPGMTPPVVPNRKPNDWCARGISRRWSKGYFSSLDYTNTYDAEIVVHELKDKGRIRVGLVGTSFIPMPYYFYIKEHLPNAEFVEFTGEIDALKAIKSEEEIEMIRNTCRIQDEVCYEMRRFLRPGISEQDIIAEMRYQLAIRGSEQGISLVGASDWGKPSWCFDPHYHSNRKLKPGDNLVIIPEHNGPSGHYAHEVVRFSLGEPHPDLIWSFERCNEAYQYLLTLLVPGADCNVILDDFNKWLVGHGLRPESRLLGHSMGYDFVERPAIVPGNGETIKLAAGMNFSVHPGIGTENALCYFGANYIIREDGLELLHQYPFNKLYIIE